MKNELNLDGIGLVLEGGGFRGIYSAGVLDYFLEQVGSSHMLLVYPWGRVMAVYPAEPIPVGRTERDPDKLKDSYEAGYERAKELHREMGAFVENE